MTRSQGAVLQGITGLVDVDMCGVNIYDYMCQLLVRFHAFHVNDSQCRSAIQYLVRSRLAICDYR